MVYKRREIQNLQKREIFITFYPGADKQSSSATSSSKNQTTANETNTTANSSNNTVSQQKNNQNKNFASTENDTISDLDNEITTKAQNKDSFKFLGDTTNYEFDFYGGETAIKNKGIKYIRNEDYLVVYDKEYIKQEETGNTNTTTTVTTSIVIDDKVVDEIINSMEKKNSNKTNCLKFNASDTYANNNTNNTSGDNTSNLTTNLFEKEMFDLWTVEKNDKNLGNQEGFAFKRPEQNKIFLNLNKPISFLQIDQQSEVSSSQTANPFFVLTDDMIKNSQKNPIIIDANILQSLLNNPNINPNKTAAKETQNQSNNEIHLKNDQEELLVYDQNKKNNQSSGNKMILEQNYNNDINIPTSFVQTKLQGISKERITDEKENVFETDEGNFKHISFDGYFPKEEQVNNLRTEENSVNNDQNIHQNIHQNNDEIPEINKEISELDLQKLDENSLNNKSPQEIEDMKQKMKKILKALDGKLEQTKTIVDSSTETSNKDSNIKADINKNLDKTQKIVDKLEDSQSQSSTISNEKAEIVANKNSIESNSNDLKSILDIPNDEESESLKKLKKIIDNTHKVTDFPGQGKQAVDKTGKWDGVPIFNISNWPDKCKYGSYQSPIHIGLSDTFFVEAHQVTVNYGKPENNRIEMYNDGFKLIVKGMFGNLKYGEHELPAKEIYIHHPSEHTFGEDQSRTDFEIQILHEDNGARVIVAVFLHDMGDNTENEYFFL